MWLFKYSRQTAQNIRESNPKILKAKNVVLVEQNLLKFKIFDRISLFCTLSNVAFKKVYFRNFYFRNDSLNLLWSEPFSLFSE